MPNGDRRIRQTLETSFISGQTGGAGVMTGVSGEDMKRPETMKGVQLIGHGGPEMLRWNDAIPVPTPGPDEALIKVSAAGVNNTDINTRIGWYSKDVSASTEGMPSDTSVEDGGWSGALKFPLIQGADLCGTVVSCGSDVEGLTTGTRVICPTNQPEPTDDQPTRFRAIGSEYDGAFAQFCTVPVRQLHDVSHAPLSDIELAAIPCAFGTAFNLLRRASLGRGDRVLVTGASGGVGLAAVQLACAMGATVTGVTSPAKRDAVLEAGADRVIARDEAPEAGQYTVIADVVGGSAWGTLIEALKPGGRYAVCGAIAGPIVEADLRTIYLNDLTLFGSTYTPHEVFAELVAMVNAGQVRPLISKTYPLEEIAQAQADFSAKTYPGKLVLIPPEV